MKHFIEGVTINFSVSFFSPASLLLKISPCSFPSPSLPSPLPTLPLLESVLEIFNLNTLFFCSFSLFYLPKVDSLPVSPPFPPQKCCVPFPSSPSTSPSSLSKSASRVSLFLHLRFFLFSSPRPSPFSLISSYSSSSDASLSSLLPSFPSHPSTHTPLLSSPSTSCLLLVHLLLVLHLPSSPTTTAPLPTCLPVHLPVVLPGCTLANVYKRKIKLDAPVTSALRLPIIAAPPGRASSRLITV